VAISERISSLQVVTMIAEGRECLCCHCQLLLQALRLITRSSQLLQGAVSYQPLHHIS
jgi:hypothetical protein